MKNTTVQSDATRLLVADPFTPTRSELIEMIQQRRHALHRFQFQICLVLDCCMFTGALIGGMYLMDATAVPSTIPADLRFGTYFVMWAVIYPAASFMSRLRLVDSEWYRVSTWNSGVRWWKPMSLYARSQLMAVLGLTVFVCIINVPFWAVEAAIGDSDLGPISLDGLNMGLKGVFWVSLVVTIARNVKAFGRRYLLNRGLSEKTLSEFYD
jgi:hypothetical protein